MCILKLFFLRLFPGPIQCSKVETLKCGDLKSKTETTVNWKYPLIGFYSK